MVKVLWNGQTNGKARVRSENWNTFVWGKHSKASECEEAEGKVRERTEKTEPALQECCNFKDGITLSFTSAAKLGSWRAFPYMSFHINPGARKYQLHLGWKLPYLFSVSRNCSNCMKEDRLEGKRPKEGETNLKSSGWTLVRASPKPVDTGMKRMRTHVGENLEG